jgi:hypothetical protein
MLRIGKSLKSSLGVVPNCSSTEIRSFCHLPHITKVVGLNESKMDRERRMKSKMQVCRDSFRWKEAINVA